MPDGRIFITITDDRSNTSSSSSDNGSAPQQAQKTNRMSREDRDMYKSLLSDTNFTGTSSSFDKYAQNQMTHFMRQQASNMLNYSINNIGNFTGDYQAQRNTQALKQGASFLFNVGMAAKAGSAAGPYGAAIGAFIAVAAESINYTLSERTNTIQNQKINYSISQLRQLSGLDGLTNGSRI